MKRISKKNITILIIAVSAALITYLLLQKNLVNSVKGIFTSANEFKAFVASKGASAPLVFFLIQVAQVIIAPIPGNVTALAGGALFGGVKASLLSSSGIALGSFIAFYLARIYGKPLVVKLIGEPIFNKYNKVFVGKYGISLFPLFLLPFFPDDALCFLAGLSKLPVKMFFFLVMAGRLPNIIFTSLAGAGAVNVPASGWAVIAGISAIVIFVSLRYGNRIEKAIYSKFHFE